jgi:glycosyltransferase involved in cell wall biosynthesis
MAAKPITGSNAKQLVIPAAIRVLTIELSQPLPIITAYDEATHMSYERVFCLIRFHSQPLGVVNLNFAKDELLPEDYRLAVWESCRDVLLRHLQEDGLPLVDELTSKGLPSGDPPRCIVAREEFLTTAPFMSVIVPTRERPESLVACLDALLSLHYPRYEIIVVDNAPTTTATADLVQQKYGHLPKIRYVREDGCGASCARNRGIQEARGEILAFTDDDVVVDTYWLAQIAMTFAQSEDIGCVTGCTLPLQLNTPSQRWFEDACLLEGMGKKSKFYPRRFDQTTRRSQFYRAGYCGHGANMAVRADVMRAFGGFDPVLGAGMPSRGGEDLAVFLHVIMQKKVLLYEPSVLVHHLHRRDYDKLRSQVFGYGTGYTAYLMHMLLRYPVLWGDLLIKIPFDILWVLLPQRLGVNRALSQAQSAFEYKGSRKAADYPEELSKIELKGYLHGPITYIKSLLALRERPRRARNKKS